MAHGFMGRFDAGERAQAMMDRLKAKDLVLDALVATSSIGTAATYGYLEGRLGEEKLQFFQSVKKDPDTGEEMTTVDEKGNTVKVLDPDSGLSAATGLGALGIIGSFFMRGPREPGGSELPLFVASAGAGLLGVSAYKSMKKMGAKQKEEADKAASKGEEDQDYDERPSRGASRARSYEAREGRYHRPSAASLGEGVSGPSSLSRAEARAAEEVVRR